MTGDPRFHELLKQIGELHDKKQKDYGSDSDPFANVRASERWGIPPWVGALVRLNDKVHRLQQFAQKGELANESAEDSMMDISVYSLMALILYREAAEQEEPEKLELCWHEECARGPHSTSSPHMSRWDGKDFANTVLESGRLVGTSTDTVEHDPDIDVR